MAKKFFFVCSGILMLALAYHLGASTATAQAPSNSIVATFGSTALVTANGDIYEGFNYNGSIPSSWAWRGNVFSGTHTPASTQTWGSVKVQQR